MPCRYALTGREVTAILMQRLVQVDGKVRTDHTYPTGMMDVVDIDKTDEHFRLVYDAKGRFVCHRISKVALHDIESTGRMWDLLLAVCLCRCCDFCLSESADTSLCRCSVDIPA